MVSFVRRPACREYTLCPEIWHLASPDEPGGLSGLRDLFGFGCRPETQVANGHNGLRSLFSELSNNREFYRLRIGVGHPGEASKVTPYLTRYKIPPDEQLSIADALNFSPTLMSEIVNADWEKAMTRLHSEPTTTNRSL